ncbi:MULTISPECIES: acyltransferase [unclassified Bifidobacterium]|uniref:acyltransferase family protein n=1 Tax=unclassified Bifidobacterium TaxID=2608897 RepID=UPI00112DD898|nr:MULTISPECIES: acyltransferase [unclassified Bifidobacterium]
MKIHVSKETPNKLKSLLILFVVLYHSVALYLVPGFPFQSRYSISNSFFEKIFQIIYMCVPIMPMFFAVSGYNFIYTLKKSTNYLLLISKKIKRIVIPTLFVSICWMYPLKFISHVSGYNSGLSLILLKKMFITGELSGHLWFMPVLFALFVIMGIGYSIFGLSYKGDLCVFVAVVGLFLCYKFFPASFLSKLFIENYLFFVLGLMLHRYQKVLFSKKNLNYKIIFVIICFAVLVLLAVLGHGIIRKYSISLIATPIILLVFLLIPIKSSKYINLLGNHCIRIYLLHSPLVYVSAAYLTNIRPIIMFLINFFVFGGLALSIGILFDKIGLNFLLGETDQRNIIQRLAKKEK